MIRFSNAIRIEWLALVLAVLFVFVGALTAQTNPDNPKFSLEIKTLKPEVVLGADIDIEIKLTNTSEEPITFAFGNRGGFPVGYKWEVRDEQGAPVARFGKRSVQLPNGQIWQVPPHPAGSDMDGQIEPGKNILQGARINNAFPFDHPGKYTIQVSRTMPWSPTIYSNTITVTVAPKAEEPPQTQQ
jgi:hypothetical protein